MFAVTLGVETVLTQVKVLAGFTLEPRAGERILTTAVTDDAQVEAGDHLHLSYEPGPVTLGREVHGEVSPVGTDGGDDPNGAVVD